MENKFGIKLNDIIVEKWGYGMTCVDFYKVTRIMGASKIELTPIKSTQGVEFEGECMPIDEADPYRKVITRMTKLDAWGKLFIKSDYSYSMRLWDGKPKYFNTLD